MCAVLVRGEVVCLWSSLLMELGVCEVRSSVCCVILVVLRVYAIHSWWTSECNDFDIGGILKIACGVHSSWI